jgi:phosphoserine phosphatase
MLRNARGVCFDLDSTVITVEGIDELAKFAGKGTEVAQMTSAAMGGKLNFREALTQRLRIIQPSESMLSEFNHTHTFQTTPGVRDLINSLRNQGTDVFLVSGGFTQMIHPVAESLGLPYHNVYANTILFDTVGYYAGFDTNAPTSYDGGKAETVRQLRLAADNKGPWIVIGDGITDLQACPPADICIGYGGVVTREAVKIGADIFITDFRQLLADMKQNFLT